jgi:hypothetical protein
MQQRMHQYKNNPGQSQQQLQAQRQQVWRSKLYLNINHIPLHLLSKYIQQDALQQQTNNLQQRRPSQPQQQVQQSHQKQVRK